MLIIIINKKKLEVSFQWPNPPLPLSPFSLVRRIPTSNTKKFKVSLSEIVNLLSCDFKIISSSHINKLLQCKVNFQAEKTVIFKHGGGHISVPK